MIVRKIIFFVGLTISFVSIPFLFQSGVGSSETKNQIGEQPEDFDKFIHKFMLDEEFQLARIRFPLRVIYLDRNLEQKEKRVQRVAYKHDLLFLVHSIRIQVYDNFERKLSDTDERAISWLGVETGVDKSYYFKRESGEWYLIRVEDLST